MPPRSRPVEPASNLSWPTAGPSGPWPATSPMPGTARTWRRRRPAPLEANVVAPLGMPQAALPLLLDSPRPRLLNITSDAAVEAYEGWGGYGAGKAALDPLSAVFAVGAPFLTVWWVDPGDP